MIVSLLYLTYYSIIFFSNCVKSKKNIRKSRNLFQYRHVCCFNLNICICTVCVRNGVKLGL